MDLIRTGDSSPEKLRVRLSSFHARGTNLCRPTRNPEQGIRAVTAQAWPPRNDLDETKLLQSTAGRGHGRSRRTMHRRPIGISGEAVLGENPPSV